MSNVVSLNQISLPETCAKVKNYMLEKLKFGGVPDELIRRVCEEKAGCSIKDIVDTLEDRYLDFDGDGPYLKHPSLWPITPPIQTAKAPKATVSQIKQPGKPSSRKAGQATGAKEKSSDAEAEELKITLEINKTCALVTEGDKNRVYEEERDPITGKLLGRPDKTLLRTFLEARENDRVILDGKSKGRYQIWFENSARRWYKKGTGLDPRNPENPQFYNLWRGFGIEPKQGDWSLLKSHIFDTLSSGRNEVYEYILNWCAHAVQKPWEIPRTALVLRSRPGAGKGQFVSVLKKIFGKVHFYEISDSDKFYSKFNENLSETVMLSVNEAVWEVARHGSRKGGIKALISEPEIEYEAKFSQKLFKPNYNRLIIASNETTPIPKENDDRRYVCIDVSNRYAKRGDHSQAERKAYYRNLMKEVNEGGAEAFLHHLMNERDISEWDSEDFPNVNDGEDIKLATSSKVIKWWHECLEYGRNFIHMTESGRPKRDAEGRIVYGAWKEVVPLDDFYNYFCYWCSVTRPDRVPPSHVVTKNLKEVANFTHSRKVVLGRKITCLTFQSLAEARKRFQEVIRIDFPDEDEHEELSSEAYVALKDIRGQLGPVSSDLMTDRKIGNYEVAVSHVEPTLIQELIDAGFLDKDVYKGRGYLTTKALYI